jgi:hypothetical protein
MVNVAGFLILVLAIALSLYIGANYIPIIGDLIRMFLDPTWVTLEWK